MRGWYPPASRGVGTSGGSGALRHGKAPGRAGRQPWGPRPALSHALLPQEHPDEGRASIYRSVIINTSKEMMCFSDFPIPEDFPNYMHNSKIMEYFRMYAQHFDLLRHIRFRTSVCRVSKRPDFAATGQWDVVTESEGKQEAAVFDGVLVCTGHHTEAHLPLSTFPGLEKFEGWYLHSRDYKSPQSFSGKQVVVVGTGNSGIDIAVELSHTAKQVFLSTKRGTWVLQRVADGGYPFDLSYLSRFMQLLHSLLPQNASNFFLERKSNARFDHALYGLQPRHRILDQHPTINDDLPNCIISGRVLVKPNVQEFTETSAIFEDGTREDIDAVVFATGYSFSFPFLEGCVKVVENQIPLYKFMFPPDLEKPTLAFIGLIQPLGAIMPISELQCRWATRVFKGLQNLPPSADMLADIAQTKEKMAKRYVRSRRHTIQVDYIPYMDELACQVCRHVRRHGGSPPCRGDQGPHCVGCLGLQCPSRGVCPAHAGPGRPTGSTLATCTLQPACSPPSQPAHLTSPHGPPHSQPACPPRILAAHPRGHP
ncbi:flavin-containing monooxygenase 5-like isoform X5 [Accipiter gentilis]|uniref:flavin-containing monooxygenase 5-like isoform X5 n=1 Tax=Astur gentilis TaxID=8957 RepID=UPI0021109517|nr:flavin-containing monooxygenase 5-like isoform X5 [Accipiter gentilis]